MIIDALISVLNPIIDTYVAIGDVESKLPLSVIQVEPTPLKTKEGIVGYMQKVLITVVDNDTERLELNSVAVRLAVLGMNGTIEDCVINSVMFESESGINFDVQSLTYQNMLEFVMDTDTR